MKIQFLDHIISQEGIEMQIPTNVKAAVSVVKMVDFSTIAESLYQLTKNDTQFIWNYEQQQFIIRVDASNIGIGALYHWPRFYCWN